jgi:hypothetical protein
MRSRSSLRPRRPGALSAPVRLCGQDVRCAVRPHHRHARPLGLPLKGDIWRPFLELEGLYLACRVWGGLGGWCVFGSEAVIEATGLRTLKNVVRLIDPATLGQAFNNNSFDEKRRPRLAFRAILKRIVAPAARPERDRRLPTRSRRLRARRSGSVWARGPHRPAGRRNEPDGPCGARASGRF